MVCDLCFWIFFRQVLLVELGCRHVKPCLARLASIHRMSMQTVSVALVFPSVVFEVLIIFGDTL
ncbi:hypothetical protein MF4836_10675 [Pseudomonas sp. MF4836]|nr:hypothetical protein MF4836_10675 [Pseudomonas sp. MF4836]